ncbi:Integrase catalytic domain-containing protein [Citrus sinensis]|nr:Integrase catalytic domain-containing protein [Citrus sinensis]
MVTDHINTLKTLFSQLTTLGHNIEENERAELLLQSLPDSYDQLIINLTNNNPVEGLVFDDVAASVLNEESRRKNKENRQASSQQAEALSVTRGRSTERGPSGSQNHGRSKSRSKKNVKCYNCGKKGHVKKECWSNQKKREGKEPESSNAQGCVASTSDDGEILYSEATTVSEGRKRLSDVWLIDSGATWHMTSRREWFHTYEPISGGSVYMGNDHALEIAGIGTIKIKIHVNGLKKNLLSLGQMDSHGYKTHVENGIMKIVKGALVLMKAEKIGANLFMLKGETLQEADACVASNGEESTMMWHLKLGHMSEQGLKILSERKLLPGLKSVSLPFCEHCVTSKQHRLKFSRSIARSKCILDLIHSDVWESPDISMGERIRAMLRTAGLPNSFWAEAAKTACYIVNRSPSTAIGLKTAMEMWTGKPADYSYLHAFGCPVYVMYNAQERTKLDAKSRRCIFLGYADGVKGYRLWDPTAHKIVISRDDLGPANKILGMQIHRDRNNRKIWLSQKNYLKKILRRFNMQDCKSISTPLSVNFKLSSSMCPSNEAERKEMSRVPYASVVGSLMFAMICTRPDIAQAVGAHWIIVKRILRYIRGTSDVALCYGGSEFTVRGYVDSDFAGDLDKRKSTTGYVFTLAGAAVSWVSKLQTVVALSTTEAEYMAATQACKEAIWIQRLLEELGHKQQKIPMFCDSQSALHIARNPAFHSRTKHIGVQYHFVREVVEDGSVDLQKIHTKENLADVLTKPINTDKFVWSRSSCGLAAT